MTQFRFASALSAAAAVAASLVLWSGIEATTVAAQVRQSNGVTDRNRAALRNAYEERERSTFESRMGGIYESSAARRYVTRIGNRLAKAWVEAGEYIAPDFRFSFQVIDNPRVGAYVLATGHVYVTRGLLTVANAEDQVAAAMAHEMAHVIADHADQRRANVDRLRDPDVLHDFNHQQELEADLLSLDVLARAGYDPAAQVRMLFAVSADSDFYEVLATAAGRRLRSRDSTHPAIADRVAGIEAAIGRPVPRWDAPEQAERRAHLRVIDGMTYGEQPRYGIVRGRTFYDAGWRYTFTVPPEFTLSADASYIQALGPDGASIRIDRRRTRRRGNLDIESYLRRYAAQGMKLEDIEGFSLSGMSAAMGRTDIETSNGPADVRVVAIQFSSRTVFRMSMQTPQAQTPLLSEGLSATIGTFRRLSREEASKLEPYRIAVIDVEEGTTLQDIAERMAPVDHPMERFALLNGLSPEQHAVPAGPVKIIVE